VTSTAAGMASRGQYEVVCCSIHPGLLSISMSYQPMPPVTRHAEKRLAREEKKQKE
jgi:hypothetical protein